MTERSKRINEAIEKSGFSYPELSKITGISKSSLQRYATGETKKIPIDCIEKIAIATNTDSRYLMCWNDETNEPGNENIANCKATESNISAVFTDGIRMIPLFNSVSAGFGATAQDEIIDYIPLRIVSDYEAKETMCIRVKGDSMSPKIDNGDIIQVQKRSSIDSGSIAVVLLDGEEGLVKKVEYGKDWIELHSFNPYYPVRRFEGPEVLRLEVVGLVKKIIKDV